jgi:nucleotide-binding universal stress UspA family protein
MSLLAPRPARLKGSVARPAAEHGTILVPVGGSDADGHAAAVAASLAGAGAELRLVGIVEVPRELSLDAQLPEEEHAVREALTRAQANAEARGVRATIELRRARDAGAEIVEAAEDSHAAAIVLDAPMRGGRRAGGLGRTARAVLRGADARVVLVTRPA